MFDLKTQPNEKRCGRTTVAHTLPLKPCCPRSGNPLEGSTVSIQYEPSELLLEVAALKEYVDSFVGGRGDVRSMEGMIQTICKDAAVLLGVSVRVVAELQISPQQEMVVVCEHH